MILDSLLQSQQYLVFFSLELCLFIQVFAFQTNLFLFPLTISVMLAKERKSQVGCQYFEAVCRNESI